MTHHSDTGDIIHSPLKAIGLIYTKHGSYTINISLMSKTVLNNNFGTQINTKVPSIYMKLLLAFK